MHAQTDKHFSSVTEPLHRPRARKQNATADASKILTVFVLSVVTLYFGKEVLIPITLALFLAFLLSPLVDLLRRLRLGRVLSVLVGVLMALALIISIAGVIGTQVADLSTGLPKYAHVIQEKVTAVRHVTVGRLSSLADKIGAHNAVIGADDPAANAIPAPDPSPDANSGHSPAPAKLVSPGTKPLDLVTTYLAPILGPIGTLSIVFIIAVFALLQREDLRDRVIRLIGSKDMHHTTLAINDGTYRLRRYFITQLCINTVFGVVIGIGLLLIGVPNPVLWGILSILLRFVPYVGTPIAAVLPMALAAAVEPGWSTLAWTAGLYFSVEAITGQAIEPTVYGNSTGLSPFSVVVAAIFWSWVWGPTGLILSTPLSLCLVVLGRHIKKLEFLDVMLGDRPALNPVEIFYQRILTADADEVQDHAEALLKNMPLSTYYDEVALKGLKMAAGDFQRDVLDEEQLEQIKATVRTLVAGLAEHDNHEPTSDALEEKTLSAPDLSSIPHEPLPKNAPPVMNDISLMWREPGAVLCIAGRGPLDEAAAVMLAQLLDKQGLNGRVVSYAEVSRFKIDTLEVTNTMMACICCLDLSGTPAHLRYLIRRLQFCLPKGTPILGSSWPAANTGIGDREWQVQMGTDYFTHSLVETINACVRESSNIATQKRSGIR